MAPFRCDWQALSCLFFPTIIPAFVVITIVIIVIIIIIIVAVAVLVLIVFVTAALFFARRFEFKVTQRTARCVTEVSQEENKKCGLCVCVCVCV
jgi:c-di-AMP phosphodiesterase-like protein